MVPISILYPDLPQTSFPNNLDTFTQYLNITPADGPLIKQYFAAIQANNQALALQIFNQIPQGSQKILTANGLNKFGQCTAALERFFKDDIQNYLIDKQNEWEGIIAEFQYIGIYSPTTQYQLNNYVTYTLSGVTNLYIVHTVPPIGTAPGNANYWRVLTIRGLQGPSGSGMAFVGEWSGIQSYNIMDCVSYDNALWGCLVANTNQTPFEGSTYWQLIYKGGIEIYPVSASQPAVQPDGALWFQII